MGEYIGWGSAALIALLTAYNVIMLLTHIEQRRKG